jgi:hypothetical protein
MVWLTSLGVGEDAAGEGPDVSRVRTRAPASAHDRDSRTPKMSLNRAFEAPTARRKSSPASMLRLDRRAYNVVSIRHNSVASRIAPSRPWSFCLR